MFGLVREKTYREALHHWGLDEHAWREEEDRLGGIIADQEKVLNSTERAKILADLEEALSLIEAYQRALSILSASDPNIIQANQLLEKFNKKGDPNATILGFQARGVTKSDDIADRIDHTRPAFEFDPTIPKSRWDQEEEYYGDEAYGSGTVRIEAEAVDEGDEKEPGYTRARIRFVDTSEEPESAMNLTGHGSDGEGQ